MFNLFILSCTICKSTISDGSQYTCIEVAGTKTCFPHSFVYSSGHFVLCTVGKKRIHICL